MIVRVCGFFLEHSLLILKTLLMDGVYKLYAKK